MTSLRLNNLIDDTVIQSLVRRHEKVPIRIRLDLLNRLIAILGNVLVQTRLDEQNFFGLDFNVGGLSLRASEGLVDHDTAVGQTLAFARRSGTQ